MKKIFLLCISLLIVLISSVEMTFAGAFTPSIYSTTSSQITFTNNSSSISIVLYWVDLDGNERYYTTLQPRASYTQDTYIGHVWNVRSNVSNALLATITSNSTYQNNTINPPSGTTSPSYTTSSSRIYFTNSSNVAVSINWVDQNGYEKFYRTLNPSESYTQDTYLDHVWVVRHSTIGTEMGRTVSTNSYQTYTITQRFDTYPNYTTNSNNAYCSNNALVYNSYSNTYTCGYNYGYTTTNPTYFQNTFPSGYNNGGYNYGSNTSWSYTVPVRQTSYYGNDNLVSYEVCDLYDGTYQDEGFNVTISGLGNMYIDTFRKKGTKIYFSTYDRAPDGRSRILRWMLNCNNGSVSQR